MRSPSCCRWPGLPRGGRFGGPRGSWSSAPRRGEGPRVPALPQRSVLAGESQEFPAAQEEGEGCDKCWGWLLGSAPAWEAGREPSCIPSTVPPVGSLCQERLQASRALRGIPACSLRPHAAAPHRWMQPRALLPRSLPSSAGTPLPLAPLYQVSPVPCAMLVASKFCCAPTRGPAPCLPQHCTCPQKPSVSAQPTRGRTLQAARALWGPGQRHQTPPWYFLAANGWHEGCAQLLGCQPGYMGPCGRGAAALPLPAHPRSPRTHCSAPCSPGGFGPASSTLGPAAAPRLPSPFHGGQLWCGLPASGRDGGAGRWEHPSCGTARHGSPARPPCRGRVISCCVAADLRVKALRGPRGRLPASGRFLSWLWDREGRPRAPSGLRHLPPALGLSAPCRDGGVGSLSSARPGDEGGPGTCRRDGGGGSLCVVAQGDVGPGGCRSLLKQPGTQKPLAGCGPHPWRWAPSP